MIGGMDGLSRRGFLRLCGVTSAAIALPGLWLPETVAVWKPAALPPTELALLLTCADGIHFGDLVLVCDEQGPEYRRVTYAQPFTLKTRYVMVGEPMALLP